MLYITPTRRSQTPYARAKEAAKAVPRPRTRRNKVTEASQDSQTAEKELDIDRSIADGCVDTHLSSQEAATSTPSEAPLVAVAPRETTSAPIPEPEPIIYNLSITYQVYIDGFISQNQETEYFKAFSEIDYRAANLALYTLRNRHMKKPQHKWFDSNTIATVGAEPTSKSMKIGSEIDWAILGRLVEAEIKDKQEHVRVECIRFTNQLVDQETVVAPVGAAVVAAVAGPSAVGVSKSQLDDGSDPEELYADLSILGSTSRTRVSLLEITLYLY